MRTGGRCITCGRSIPKMKILAGVLAWMLVRLRIETSEDHAYVVILILLYYAPDWDMMMIYK